MTNVTLAGPRARHGGVLTWTAPCIHAHVGLGKLLVRALVRPATARHARAGRALAGQPLARVNPFDDGQRGHFDAQVRAQLAELGS